MKIPPLTIILLLGTVGCGQQDNAAYDRRLAELENRVGRIEASAGQLPPVQPVEPQASRNPSPAPLTPPAPETPQMRYELLGPSNFVGSNRRLYPSLDRCEAAKEALIEPIRRERERDLEEQGNPDGTYYVPRLTCIPT